MKLLDSLRSIGMFRFLKLARLKLSENSLSNNDNNVFKK